MNIIKYLLHNGDDNIKRLLNTRFKPNAENQWLWLYHNVLFGEIANEFMKFRSKKGYKGDAKFTYSMTRSITWNQFNRLHLRTKSGAVLPQFIIYNSFQKDE
jgi:hypothetical protein